MTVSEERQVQMKTLPCLFSNCIIVRVMYGWEELFLSKRKRGKKFIFPWLRQLPHKLLT